MKRPAAIAVVWIAAAALAQNKPLLDLTAAPQAPAAGSGMGALALADQLNADASSVERPGGTAAKVRGELRRLARELLASGEKAGQAGSARIVMGRTLAGAIPELDRLIGAAPESPLLPAAAADLSAARALLASGNPDPDVTLRDALAALSKLAGPPTGVGGWIDEDKSTPPDPLGPKLDSWSALPGVSPEAIDALRQLEAIAETAAAWPAYEASTRRMRAMTLGAAAAFDPAPSWLPEPARRSLAEQFSKAITTLGSPDSRAGAMDDLTRLASIAALIRRIDQLEDNPAGKRIRAAVAQAVALPPSQADARTMGSFGQLLSLVAARSAWPEEKALMRQLRPGFRTLSGVARQTEGQVISALPEILRRPEAMTDPGVLASVSAHRRAVADVEGLVALNQALVVPGEGEPLPDKRWQNLANRALKLSQDMTRADQKEAAMTSLRALFTHIDRIWRLPGEESLRQAVKEDAGKPAKEQTSTWALLSGGREAAMASEITDRRAGWLFDWERGITAGSDGQRLEVLHDLMECMERAGPIVTPGEAYAALQAWPGWELSSTSMGVFAAGLPDQLAEATRLLLAGETAKAAELVAAIRKDFAVALLAGRLAQEAQRRGISPDRSAPGVLRELTAGGPIGGRSWRGRDTDLLDDVCRYSEEVAALRKLGAKDKADTVQRFANRQAGEMIERMNRAER